MEKGYSRHLLLEVHSLIVHWGKSMQTGCTFVCMKNVLDTFVMCSLTLWSSASAVNADAAAMTIMRAHPGMGSIFIVVKSNSVKQREGKCGVLVPFRGAF